MEEKGRPDRGSRVLDSIQEAVWVSFSLLLHSERNVFLATVAKSWKGIIGIIQPTKPLVALRNYNQKN